MKRILFTTAVALCTLAGVFTALATASKSNVGQQLPDLKVDYLKAKPETAGKPLIVEFWATWCGPCKQSIPHLNEINKKYKDKGLVIIGITDEPNQTIRQFIKSVPIEYNAATDKTGKISKGFGIQGIPHAMLVDKTGKIVWEGHPMSMQESEIEKILE